MSGFGNSFSKQFGVPEKWFSKNKVFDPTLDVDSPLFIDPFLLPESSHEEFSKCAFEKYEEHFVTVLKALSSSRKEGDKLWKGALKLFSFGETKGLSGTCLGYSKSTQGSGFGKVLSERALRWAKEVVELGVEDPELFSAMSVFEEGIGADLISDMTANIAIDCIIEFNARVLSKIYEDTGIEIPLEEFNVKSRLVHLPKNPFSDTPVILLADDILRHLPVLDSATDLAKIAAKNDELRDRVNSHIGDIFKIRTKREKDAIKAQAMADAAAFQTLLDLLKILEKTPYSITKDPLGLVAWREHAPTFAATYPLSIVVDPDAGETHQIDAVVEQIVAQFQHLVENCRLNRTFYSDDGKPRHERYAQLLFYAIAVAYCDANNLDVSPESDAGAGPVDFKFSRGKAKVVVEIKLSTNQSIVQGYKKQIEAYARAENTDRGHYVVVDVGRMGNKFDKLIAEATANPKASKQKEIHYVDGTLRPSASKL